MLRFGLGYLIMRYVLWREILNALPYVNIGVDVTVKHGDLQLIWSMQVCCNSVNNRAEETKVTRQPKKTKIHRQILILA